MNRLQQMKLKRIIKEEVQKVLKENDTDEVDVLDIKNEIEKEYPLGWMLYNTVLTTSLFEKSWPIINDMISGESIPKRRIMIVFKALESLMSQIKQQ